MGGGIGGFKLNFSGLGEEKEEVKKDNRRKNSLAFNIAKFVQYEEDDFAPLIDAIQKERLSVKQLKIPKVTKFTKLADSILAGNMRTLRDMVTLNFKSINRVYKEQHFDQCVIHFVCQEGYVDMFDFMLNPNNHSQFDVDVEIEIDPLNNKNRTPLMLCFTPPSATVGQHSLSSSFCLIKFPSV